MNICYVHCVVVLSIGILTTQAPLTVKLKNFGTATIQVFLPKHFNFTIIDKMKCDKHMDLYMSINSVSGCKDKSQLAESLTLTEYEDYYRWVYINDDLELKPGDVFYYWVKTTIKAANCTFVSTIRNCTVLEDGSLYSPPDPVPAEYTYLESLRDEHGNLFDVE